MRNRFLLYNDRKFLDDNYILDDSKQKLVN